MLEKKKMQYLYGGSEYCFMDMETYAQVEIPAERLQWESKFLLESMIVEIVFYGDEIPVSDTHLTKNMYFLINL